MLKPYLAKYDLPALAAAIVKDGTIIAAGAVGTRRVGTNIPVTIDDRFHIGSDTKAMTALLAAMLVEEGKLRWDTTVAEIFPELTGKMAPQVGGIRLEQLLSHTSGIPSDNDAQDKLVLDSYGQTALNLDEMRYWIVERLVAMPLQIAARRALCLCEHGLCAGRRDRRAPLWLDLGAACRDAHFRPARA